MTTSMAQEIELPEAFKELFSSLDKHEREHLSLGLIDIIRQDDVDIDKLNQLFAGWSMTVTVRQHPHLEPQAKEYRRLLETGELFEGLDDATIMELQDNADTH